MWRVARPRRIAARQHDAPKRFVSARRAAVEPLGMGEMGERERLEQEHADKMRLKNRDESAVKVQFQIDA